ncbi:uncharacterized protein SOCE26_025890 [Sorangium cellulosum]|uniref:Glycosyltransferase RgtA/B/C/D-like domain-containing protein n=1 Tax=Sorangium cellulosum TaxID=56 RepID=A0A2L0EPG4_SORCE|nr:uncharacterized protein SOCE26_025890 [Sorangium cellulosum]
MTQNLLDEAPEPAPEEPRGAATPARLTQSLWGARAAALRARVVPWLDRLPGFGVMSLRVVIALAAVAAVVTYVVLGIVHLRYPFEIEWMEGGMLDEVRRALEGQKLYVKPTVEFVPFIYSPFYFYVAAAFSKVLGLSFFSARLVSFLASLGVIAFVARFVHRETGGKLAAFLAAGVFAGTYHLSAGFYDIARVDSLFVLLLLGALYLVRFRRSLASHVAAAALFTLALHTKQSASVIFLPVAAHVLLSNWRRGLVFSAAGAVMMVGSVLLLDWIHDGWFWYFVFWLPRQHPWVSRMWTDFWRYDLMTPLSVSCLFALYYWAVGRVAFALPAARAAEGSVPQDGGSAFAPPFDESRRFYLFAAVGMLGASWAGRLHSGGWPNVIMPGFAILSILFGLGLQAGIEAAARLAAPRRLRVEAFLLAVAAVQFACLAYDPDRYVPKPKDAEAGNHLLDRMRKYEGDIFLPAHGHLVTLVGKRPYAHEMAIGDILGIGGGPAGVDLRASIAKAIADRRFGAIITDTDFFKKEIQQSYRREGRVFEDKKVFWPVTGFRARPEAVNIPKKP